MFSMPKLTLVVKNLLIINALFFVSYMSFGREMYDLLASHWIENPLFKPWQLITHFFMHGDLGHIFKNMLMLFFIGTFLESMWGAKKFLQYYLFCGLVGYIIYMIIQYVLLQYHGQFLSDEVIALAVESKYIPGNIHSESYIRLFNTSLVGASGAIFGIITALWMTVPNQEVYVMFIPIPVKIKYVSMFLLMYEIYNQMNQSAGDNVSHLGHLSGMLAGFLLIKYWEKKGNSNNFQHFR